MRFLNVDLGTLETSIQNFDRIANMISNKIIIRVNATRYRIVDFEFYIFSKAMPDPHTYKNDLQLQMGKLYLHSSGIDITFGDGINYGGILIRSVIKLANNGKEYGYMEQQYDGPQNVATELFSNFNFTDNHKNEFELIELTRNHGDYGSALKILKTKRFGLKSKPADIDDFFKNLPIRYIAVLPKFPKFKQTIKGIENILGEQVLNQLMSVEDAREILGYDKKSLS